MILYETYTRYIYEWLTDTFTTMFNNNADTITSILERIDSILTILQNGLYLGCFAFLFWVLFSIVRPYFFKV